MPSIDINDVGAIGVIRDQPSHELVPEAWNFLNNVRIIENSIGRLGGYTQVFGTVPQAPQHLAGVRRGNEQLWLYFSLTGAFAADSTNSNFTTVTRSSSVYAAAVGADWNSTFLGGITIANNGTDLPQYWPTASTSVLLADLPNWPSFLRAKVIRSFGPYLMAMNLTASGVTQPHDVRWSHPADPGAVPTSWDITDPTVDAGQVTLPDIESGGIVDGLPLQGRFYVYKENSVWRFRATGGRFVFDQDAFLETIGLLCARALAVTGDGKRHIFASQDDIMLHDGNGARSVLDKKLKRTLFGSIDVTNYRNSFMMIHPLRGEAWFCYPETGNSFPNRAIIYNYESDRISEGDCDWRHWAPGVIQTSDAETWNSTSGTWDEDTGLWSNSDRRKIVLVRTAVNEFALLDTGATRDGTVFTGTLQRTGLGIIGRKRNGDWIEDFQQRKLVTRLWPKVSGGAVSIRIGSHQVPDGAVTWSAAKTFDPSVQRYVDFVVEGPAIALEISGTTPFKIDGYKIEMELTGNF